jgi:hypothetical protein
VTCVAFRFRLCGGMARCGRPGSSHECCCVLCSSLRLMLPSIACEASLRGPWRKNLETLSSDPQASVQIRPSSRGIPESFPAFRCFTSPDWSLAAVGSCDPNLCPPILCQQATEVCSPFFPAQSRRRKNILRGCGLQIWRSTLLHSR